MLGVRDADALEAVLVRARQKWHYDADADLAGLAAAYGFGLATAHPFNDGNKRIALLTMAVFLGLNGKALERNEFEVHYQPVVGAENGEIESFEDKPSENEHPGLIVKSLQTGKETVIQPKGTVPPGHPWWGNPKFDVHYDLAGARKMMADAGYSAAKALKVKVQISASGSGQMQPLPMNEFVQQNLKQCHFDVAFDVIEWNTLFTNWRKGAKDPSANGANAINVSFAAMDPFFAMVRFTSTKAFPPTSNNWGYFGNAEFDDLIAKARSSFDDKERDAALARLHARIVEEAPFILIAHDVGPRAMSPKVKNVVQPRSWFIDIATMSMD